MTLDEAVARVRARRLTRSAQVLADWQGGRSLIIELFGALSAAPQRVTGDFEFALTRDQRIAVWRLSAVVLEGDENRPSQLGPMQVGTWRIVKGVLVFFPWGCDVPTYRVADLDGALLSTAEIIEGYRDQGVPQESHVACELRDGDVKV